MFSEIFNYDNGFWRFMGKLWDALVLNILWVVCCIPLVTVGAATTAVYYVALKLARDEEGYVISSFFKSFKENFRQATALWLVLAAGAAALAVDCRFLLAGDGAGCSPWPCFSWRCSSICPCSITRSRCRPGFIIPWAGRF